MFNSRAGGVMRRFSGLAAALLAALAVSACAVKPATDSPGAATLAFAQEQAQPDLSTPGNVMSFPGPRTGLAGRTLKVNTIADIKLARNEVVLTFDDGPIPGKTQAILNALDKHDVKATFLMVGSMARSYPDLVRKVAARGHAIGTHTQNHPNLAGMSYDKAIEEIAQGRRSVASALIPTGMKAAPFFRFPYLSDTPALRKHLASQGVVVIDVNIDSKDYFVSSPDQVRTRTLARLTERGSGIILLHDLHQRTVAMLPKLLDDLHARGFKVVNLQPAKSVTDGLLVSQLTN